MGAPHGQRRNSGRGGVVGVRRASVSHNRANRTHAEGRRAADA
ncbi:hypothetical protein KPATCC21470_3609 [Kitasatospora purpeofusca]